MFKYLNHKLVKKRKNLLPNVRQNSSDKIRESGTFSCLALYAFIAIENQISILLHFTQKDIFRNSRKYSGHEIHFPK